MSDLSLFDWPLVLADMAAGAIIMSICICRVNCMTRRTSHLLRLAFVVLAAGGFALLVAPLFRSAVVPGWPQMISHLGLALYLLAERRKSCTGCDGGEKA